MISMQNLENLFGNEFREVPISDMMKEADLNGDQMISFEEFKIFIKEAGRNRPNAGRKMPSRMDSLPLEEEHVTTEELLAAQSV